MLSNDTKIIISSLASFVTGLLVASGKVSPADKDSLQAALDTLGGLIISIIGVVYLLESLLLHKKAELKNTPTIETPPDASAQPQA